MLLNAEKHVYLLDTQDKSLQRNRMCLLIGTPRWPVLIPARLPRGLHQHTEVARTECQLTSLEASVQGTDDKFQQRTAHFLTIGLHLDGLSLQVSFSVWLHSNTLNLLSLLLIES